MRFHEKLDFLMNITATTNVLLSNLLDVDPSYISRLRRGERNPIQSQKAIEAMANHFAQNAQMDYHLDLLADMIYPDYRAMDEEGRADLLIYWLSDKGLVIEGGTSIFQDSQDPKDPSPTTCCAGDCGPNHRCNEIYYGLEGKRQAALRFLATLMKDGESKPIFIFDDSDSIWLPYEEEYRLKVKKALLLAVEKGHSIITIHNTKRSLDDMLKSIDLWILIHFTGKIESYYYPKVRDDLFKKTLLVVPDTVAVVSNAVESDGDETANFYVTDPNTLKALEEEFNQVLSRCIPLFEIFIEKERRVFFDLMVKYDRVRGDTIYNLEGPSLMTMPDQVRNQITKRHRIEDESYVKNHQKRKSVFREKILEERYYEIVYKKDPQDIREGKTVYPHSSFSHGHPIYYTKEEYVTHLENIISLAQEFENFHFVLEERQTSPEFPLYLKEDQGVVLVSPIDGATLIHTEESSITAAFYYYLRNSTGLGNYEDKDKPLQIEKIQAYIEEIKNQA